MRRTRRAIIGLILAALAAAGSVWSWLAAQSSVVVAPVLDGEPQTTSVAYNSQLIVLALLLATIAGVLVVLGVAGLRTPSPPSSAKQHSRS